MESILNIIKNIAIVVMMFYGFLFIVMIAVCMYASWVQENDDKLNKE